jgi:hypothetical protein
MMGAWLALGAWMGMASANTVVVPPFTPKTTSDFSIADQVTDGTLLALGDMSVEHVPMLELTRRLGDLALSCADDPACLTAIWARFPEAQLAVIGSVTWVDGQVQARALFYGPSDLSPLEVLASTGSEADLSEFGDQVAFFAGELVPLLPPREPPAAVEPLGPPDGGGDPVAEALAQVEAEQSGAPLPVALPPGIEDLDTDPDAAVIDPRETAWADARTGLPLMAFQAYMDSGLDVDEWSTSAMIRTGKFIIELQGGALFGDVDRNYLVRAQVIQVGEDTFSTVDSLQHEAFVNGNGVMGSLALGYAVAWWFEPSVVLGVQGALKHLDTGWEHVLEDGSLYEQENRSYTPSEAVMLFVEPRFRLFFVATGPVKPFGLAGATIRAFDGFSPPDLVGVDYPDSDGGFDVGLTVGGGLTFDTKGPAYGFLEVPWTHILKPHGLDIPGDSLIAQPSKPESLNQYIAFKAGVGFAL